MYSLRPDNDQTLPSCFSSTSKTQPLTLEKCPHSKQISSKSRDNCFDCGMHLSKNKEVKSYKTIRFSFKAYVDVEFFCLSLFKKKLLNETLLKSTHPYYKNRVSLIEMIFKVSERLHLSQNTMQMAVSFLDFVVIKGYIPSSQYQIYAITGIMLAAKAIELDKRIPFVSSLRKCAIEDFKPSEIKKTEEIMLEILGWNTQFATLIDLIEYFLSQGIIFSNDLINFDRKADFKEINLGLKLQKQDSLNEKTQRFASRVEKSKSLIEKNTSFESNCKNIKNEKENIMKKEENVKEVKHLSEKERWDLVLKIETELRTLSNLIIKDPIFLESNTKFLAGALIGFIRKKYGFKNIWNEELIIISNGIKENDIIDDFYKIFCKLDEHNVVPIENEPKTNPRKLRNTLLERKDIYQKINSNNAKNSENEQCFAPLNTSNLENQARNTVYLKNPVFPSIKPKTLTKILK